jgi:uncharacterized protein
MKQRLLRDAVHGDIELDSLELALVDTPEFQRLRGIKQLGTASLVYPSAVHTRFEHSLGTSWMARAMITVLRRSAPISDDEASAIRLAALVHDITHIPFGHTLEDERRVLPRHDKDENRFDHFLRQSSLAHHLHKSGYQEQVLKILQGEAGFASEIVIGAITADLLDYLKRDTYFVGFTQYYDARIFQSFLLEEGRFVVNLEKNGMLRRDALSELVNLLRIRYTLTERVYFHHAKIASGAMISKAVEAAMNLGMAAEELREFRDDTLLWNLQKRYGDQPAIAHLVQCLHARQLYRACFVLSVDVGEERQKGIVERYHERPQDRESLETAVAQALGIEPYKVIVYCPSIRMSIPEAEVRVRMDTGRVIPLSDSNNEEIRVLKQKHKFLWRFFIFLDRDSWGQRDLAHQTASRWLAPA